MANRQEWEELTAGSGEVSLGRWSYVNFIALLILFFYFFSVNPQKNDKNFAWISPRDVTSSVSYSLIAQFSYFPPNHNPPVLLSRSAS